MHPRLCRAQNNRKEVTYNLRPELAPEKLRRLLITAGEGMALLERDEERGRAVASGVVARDEVGCALLGPLPPVPIDPALPPPPPPPARCMPRPLPDVPGRAGSASSPPPSPRAFAATLTNVVASVAA